MTIEDNKKYNYIKMIEKTKITSDVSIRITEILDSMKELLIYKNSHYGNSALSPRNIFYKGCATDSILIRLDDKIGRIIANKNQTPRVNDICDIIGYLTLLLISMNVKSEDIAKMKD